MHHQLKKKSDISKTIWDLKVNALACCTHFALVGNASTKINNARRITGKICSDHYASKRSVQFFISKLTD